MDLGIDSVALIDLAQQMEQEIQIELYPTLFFEYQNIEALAGYFVREHSDKFSSFLGISQTLPKVEPLSPHFNDARVVSVPIQTSVLRPERSVRDIAIIGVGGRFSKSADVDQFWKHLQNGTDLVGEIPKDHFDFKPSFDTHPQAPNKSYCKWGSFLDDVDKFDAGFFRVSDHEAELMDPQMRILLEVMHSAAEDAGLAGRIRGTRTGVYVAACFHDYGQEILRTGKTTEPFDGTGNASSMLANRPSFFWNLRGPSLTVDTACSSSLVALHLACQALRHGECEMAFASGVNLALSPQHYIYFCSIGALSPTGRCHTFDARADGYVPGEAIASVLLKPLDQAIADGDPIHAVIKGTAINHGGYTNTVTAPNPQMEAEVLIKAWEDAGIDPATLSYIEAHGTGTKLGDPVEIQGIKLAFQKFTDRKGFCALGSAKAHLGHTESAAGIVGVVKTVLSMKNRCIPAMPDFKELNPLIQLKESPLYINTASQSWASADSSPLRAGVSSFGFGGTYAHVVLESHEPATRVAPPTSQPELFLFSARTSDRLEALLKKFSSWLEDADSKRFSHSDIAFTLQTGREQMEQRIAFVASNHSEALQRISEALENKRSSNLVGRTVEKNSVGRIGQSPEDLHYFQSLYGAGQFEKLGALWIWGAEIPWQKVRDISTCHRIPMPTYEFERNSYWFVSRGAMAKDVLPESSPIEQLAVTPITNDLRSFVTNSIARLLNLAASDLHSSTDLQDIGFDSIMGMQLMKEIQENFNVRFYPSEAQLNSSLGALLDYLESQVNPPLVSNSGSNSRSVAKKQLAFVLSAPRSGSTLLRVMLAGHSGIFCPPELHLLPFSTLEERSRILSARAPFLSEGLPRAIMELRQCDANLAVATVNEWQQKGLSTPQIYDTLLGLAGERIVIDKSPSYAEDLKVLERSHVWFPDAKYIFLYRHPFAVMESYVRNRFDKLFQQNAADPWQAAADVWYRINRNLRALRDQLPASNFIEIRYEDLVAAPEAVSRKLCTFLDIPFEPSLLRPYEGKRMTNGLRPVSLSVGDPNFNDHQEIDPALAEGWRTRLSTLPNLPAEAAALASELGYSIENNTQLQLAPAQKLFLLTYRENPIWNLEHRFIFESARPLNRECFENAWRSVIARHPAFRTCFSLDHAQLEQGVIPRPFSVEWSDFSTYSAEKRELAIQEVISALHRSINLHEPPLIRCGIVDMGSGKYQMICIYHHLIGDGISSAVLFEEVLKQYLAPSSAAPFEPAIELYSQRVNQLIESGGSAHETFWRKHLENYAYSNPPMDESTAPALFSTELEMRFAGEYLKLPNIPSFAVSAAALYQVIAEWEDSTDVVIGHRLHGRAAGCGTTEDPIGCFAIDIPLRLTGAELESANVATAFRTAFEQIPSNGITYTPLVVLGKLPAAEKLTAIRLNYQPRPLLTSNEEFKVISQTVRTVQAPEHQRLYLLDFIVRAQPEGWSLIVRYSTTRHREDTIRKLVSLWSARVRPLSLE